MKGSLVLGALAPIATLGQSAPRFRPSGVNGAFGGANWGTRATQSNSAVKEKRRAKNKAAKAARRKSR